MLCFERLGYRALGSLAFRALRLALSFVKLASFGPHCSTQTALRGLLGLPGLLCFALIGLFVMRWARSVVEVA